MDAKKFLTKMDECVSEFRKVQGETADEVDLAHFFDPKLKKFLADNRDEINILFKIKSLTPFRSFAINYLLKK
jgi:hypothetical protein